MQYLCEYIFMLVYTYETIYFCIHPSNVTTNDSTVPSLAHIFPAKRREVSKTKSVRLIGSMSVALDRRKIEQHLEMMRLLYTVK